MALLVVLKYVTAVYKEQITWIYAKSERLILLEGVILGFC